MDCSQICIRIRTQDEDVQSLGELHSSLCMQDRLVELSQLSKAKR
jgi:hypothetical protein